MEERDPSEIITDALAPTVKAFADLGAAMSDLNKKLALALLATNDNPSKGVGKTLQHMIRLNAARQRWNATYAPQYAAFSKARFWSGILHVRPEVRQ